MDQEKFLLKMGVSQGHIDRMKRERCVTSYEYQLFYEWVGKTEYHVQAPVEKIHGLTETRGKDGASWWDHFIGKAGMIERDRIEYLRGKLEEMGLERFRAHFAESRYSVDLGYYPEHDVFIVENDGNHRILWAKIVGAPTISAVVHHFRFLPDHFERYTMVKERKEQFESTLDHFNLRWEDHELYFGDSPIGRFDPGYDDRNNYQEDFRAEWIIRSFDEMEKKINRIGEIHRVLTWIKKESIRLRFLELMISLSGDPPHGDSASSMLKNMYQAGWCGIK